MTREEQRRRRRAAILRAGLDRFLRKGYAGARIQDIAEAAGMSVGLLFHYFASKEALYEELIRIGMSGPTLVFTGDHADPLAFFERAAREILGAVCSDAFVARLFALMMNAQASESVPESARRMLDAMDPLTPSAALIARGQRDGTIRQGDPTALAVAFWSAINGVAQMIALAPGIPCPRADWLVDILRAQGEETEGTGRTT